MKSRLLALTTAGLLLSATGAAADNLSPPKQKTHATNKRIHDLLRPKRDKTRSPARDVTAAPRSDPVAVAAQNTTEALTGDGPIVWRGLTLFGAIDSGVAWQSHGAPFNGAYPQGLEYAIGKNSNHAGFNVAPGGMGYSGIGLKGEQEILPGLAGVFAVNTNFDPASGRLSDGPASLVQNNGVALANQSSNGDSRSAGQAFNDYAYAGVSSKDFGELTFGRQRTLTTDDRARYDPIAGSLAFSLLGYSGTLSSGDTENARFDDSLKYRVDAGPARFGAIYKFASPGTGSSPTHGAAYQVSAGFDYAALSFDAVYSHVSDAISLSSLSAAQVLVEPTNSLAATISDNSAVLLSAKYTWSQFKFFGGYERVDYADPKDPIAAPYVDGNGYAVSVSANNAYQYHDKILQVFWTGLKYAYNDHLVLSGGYYHELQNSYGKVGCNFAAPTKAVSNTSTCSGAEDALGMVAEYHFSRRFEIYGGLMYSRVSGGMASGFLYRNSVDPAVGLRYAF